MTEDKYKEAITAVVMCMRILAIHDLPKILEGIVKAESLGPIFEPTLYLQKAKAMGEDKEILLAAMPLYRMAKGMEQT